jgi:hypothetical protein
LFFVVAIMMQPTPPPLRAMTRMSDIRKSFKAISKLHAKKKRHAQALSDRGKHCRSTLIRCEIATIERTRAGLIRQWKAMVAKRRLGRILKMQQENIHWFRSITRGWYAVKGAL